ncbi:WXG100 family type VII secretion target [Saccharopolyspora dendranthemae]|uniref:Excreted virulence factor EspC (Type VII ESX diderm) n=1 Tax=Saccharopolyspora dendranthemae TaxID=1181886 RepID=A0A561V9Q4_9PSEU|nr:type VII secretion target [Saccharopolyspora dendranthemae]TWG08342.1 excreted virulence factor EspC (type VII ESX diderm) [Saccharopolyspora dendranthemae]
MPDFTVDVGGLDALSKNLDRTTENIEGATKRIKDLGTGSLGPAELDEACADFRADWEEGLDKLREAVDQVKGALDASRQTYAELDSKIAESLQKMSGGESAGEGNSASGGTR